ncbi:hypothetical protein CAPTEDRAFT_208963 [Capitella teleta]|uniref:EGF-like domain-containing protein n=1 Tax=Capitella teleta TaxID=283909 RepID=R7U388_CAPTE|nr:hypothetical protein CAPTEDRAFT_208963 [Capitella teleta]|eukprot:ELT97645.1 hypothetical protein CAPTEDRAFT_208963 [Capitella teleta]
MTFCFFITLEETGFMELLKSGRNQIMKWWIIFATTWAVQAASDDDPVYALYWSHSTLFKCYGDPYQTWFSRVYNGQRVLDTITQSGSNYGAMAASHPDRILFYFDNGLKDIQYMIPSTNSSIPIKSISAPCSEKVFGLTVDWVNKNLYWTDAVYNWIAMAAIDDPTSFRFIIEGSLHSPHGIAVHPGSRSKIESMHISGQQRRVEVAENIVSTFVSFDTLQQTLLIAVIDFDSAFVYNGSSGSLGDRRLFYHNIINKTDDVMIYNPAKQPPLPENPCASKNCEHMCIATSDNAAECLCNHLHELQDDENCESLIGDEGLVYSPALFYHNGSSVFRAKVWLADVGGDPHKLYTTEVPIGVIDVDHHNEMMYFSSTNHIYAVGMRDGMYPSVRVQLLDVDVEIGGLAVDWLAHRLYWTNFGEKSITHSTLHGNEMKSIVRDRNGLQGIVVNALTKTIYWTEAYEDTGAILTSDVDGQMINTLVSNDVHYPQHLHIDYDLGRLFWSDSARSVIDSVLLSGMQRISYPVSTVPFGIAVFAVSGFKLNRLPIKSLAVQQDYLVWTSRAANESGVYWKRRELHSVVQHYEPAEEVGDIKVFWHSQSPVTERDSPLTKTSDDSSTETPPREERASSKDLRAARARDCFHLPRGNQRILRGQKANVQLANTGGQKFAENKEPESKRIHHCQIATIWKAPILCVNY